MTAAVNPGSPLKLDRSLFHASLSLLALAVPRSHCEQLVRTCNKENWLLQRPKLKSVVDFSAVTIKERVPIDIATNDGATPSPPSTPSTPEQLAGGTIDRLSEHSKLVLLSEQFRSLADAPAALVQAYTRALGGPPKSRTPAKPNKPTSTTAPTDAAGPNVVSVSLGADSLSGLSDPVAASVEAVQSSDNRSSSPSVSSPPAQSPTVFRVEIPIDYRHFNTEQVLRKLLPNEQEIPCSFETVGHIAHINLRDHLDKYKFLIGEVIIDKNPGIKTVINKVGIIASQFREFQMELLAGKNDFITEVHEQGCRFRFDYSKVYWNSRLQFEHERIAQSFVQPNDIVCDVFAGVGPFAVPTAKHHPHAVVFANDLNPNSYKALVDNSQLNKVQNRLKCFNMDGRDFIRAAMNGSLPNLGSTATPNAPFIFHRLIMNLPATAVEFLGVFFGGFQKSQWTDRGHALPVVHCYLFAFGETDAEYRTHALTQVQYHLRYSFTGPNDPHLIHVQDVRDVAPRKHMFCISFRIPEAVAYGTAGTVDPAADALRSSQFRELFGVTVAVAEGDAIQDPEGADATSTLLSDSCTQNASTEVTTDPCDSDTITSPLTNDSGSEPETKCRRLH